MNATSLKFSKNSELKMFIKNFTYSNKSQSVIRKFIKNLSKIQSELNIN